MQTVSSSTLKTVETFLTLMTSMYKVREYSGKSGVVCLFSVPVSVFFTVLQKDEKGHLD